MAHIFFLLSFLIYSSSRPLNSLSLSLSINDARLGRVGCCTSQITTYVCMYVIENNGMNGSQSGTTAAVYKNIKERKYTRGVLGKGGVVLLRHIWS